MNLPRETFNSRTTRLIYLPFHLVRTNTELTASVAPNSAHPKIHCSFYNQPTQIMLATRASTAKRLARSFATVVDSKVSGIKVSAIDNGQPTTAVTFLVRAGSRYESSPGVAHALKNFAFKVCSTFFFFFFDFYSGSAVLFTKISLQYLPCRAQRSGRRSVLYGRVNSMVVFSLPVCHANISHSPQSSSAVTSMCPRHAFLNVSCQPTFQVLFHFRANIYPHHP